MNSTDYANKAVKRFKDLHIVGKFFIAIFLIVLLEGAIRKWIWPSATIPLLFFRDLLVVSAVVWGLLHRKFNFGALPEILLVIWTGLVVLWTTLQIILAVQPPIVGILGIRTWILYFWFVVLCMRTLSWSDIEYLMKLVALTLLILIPLVILQFMSSPTDIINKQANDDIQVFTVIGDIVRPTATFTFTAGYTIYLAFVLPIVISLMNGGIKTITSPSLKISLILLFFLGVLLSGSRTAIFSTVLIVGLFYVFMLLLGRLPKPKPKQTLLLIFLLPTILFFSWGVIEKSIEANQTRIANASATENTQSRIINTVLGSERIWDSFEPMGYGIGFGSNAAKKFTFGYERKYIELESDRVLYEGGVIGILLALLKISIAIYGLIMALIIWKKYNEVLPIALWLILCIQLLTAQMLGQLTIHAIVFMLLAVGASSLTAWREEKIRRNFT